jgi:hypothetical protein
MNTDFRGVNGNTGAKSGLTAALAARSDPGAIAETYRPTNPGLIDRAQGVIRQALP